MIPCSYSTIALGKEHHRAMHLTALTLFLVKKGIFSCQEKELFHGGREAEDGPSLPPSSGSVIPNIHSPRMSTNDPGRKQIP